MTSSTPIFTKLEPDPYVKHASVQFNKETGEPLNIKFENEGQEFGIVLLTNWPPPRESVLELAYHKFRSMVYRCILDSGGDDSMIYLYPFQDLHVTVAASGEHTVFCDRNDVINKKEMLSKEWVRIIDRASRRSEWPTNALRLKTIGAQIGCRNGILFWEELTGGLDAMRKCVKDEVESCREELLATGVVDLAKFSIPGIVHSTFLRFRGHNLDNIAVETLLNKFQGGPLEVVLEDFPIVETDSVTLISETTPCMHISSRDSCQLWSNTCLSG